MTTRPWRWLAPLVVTSLALAACGPNADETDEPPTDGGASPGESAAASPGEMEIGGDLTIYGFSCTTGDLTATSRFDLFLETYPDVEYECSESGFEAQPFLAALGGDDPPDVVNMPRNTIGSYISRDLLAPMDDCLSATGFDTSVFYEAGLSQVTVDGAVYALPEFFNTRNWIINNAAFEDAGIDPASFDVSDWDAIAEANEALIVDDGGLSRIGVDPKIPEFLELWVRANGSQSISDDGLESMLDDPAVAEALEYAYGLINAHGSPQAFLDFRGTWDFFGAENQVAADQIGAWPMEQWYLNVLAENSPEAEITVLPFMTQNGDPITLADGNSWAIVEGTDNVDAACALATHMVATETWVHAAESRRAQRDEEGLPFTGIYTGNSEADETIFSEIVDLGEFPIYAEAVQAVVDNQPNAFAFPPSPAGEEFEQARNSAVEEVLGGEPASDALATADQDAQDAMDSAR